MKKKRIKALEKVNASLRSQLFSYKTLASENLDEIESLTEKYNQKVDDLNFCGMRVNACKKSLDQAENDIKRAEIVIKDNVIKENHIVEFTAKMMAYKHD